MQQSYAGGMAFSDLIVLQTLARLIDERGPNALISQTAISQASGVSLRTTTRALRRLTITGKVVSTFNPGIGYRYRICNDELARNG